ncbi:Ribonuclease MRP protein subunit rmp1 [Elasticomyces elasticus]|nr:Ribonuclease MRP protein subunit rmp1 [Elasticomyces elasticus]KAK4992950.1 Ribonuclease MRP protein subunit rmp1 [Elasticomyces elasticus]
MSKPVKITETQQEELAHLSALLHLIHHRNHNQHRRSTWYRHFGTFRRELRKLLASLNSINAPLAPGVKRSEKAKQDRSSNALIRRRLDFWQDLQVPKWHHAFSQLVASGRFAASGIALLAVLGQAEVEKVLARFAEEEWGEAGVKVSPSDGAGGITEDVGEFVQREAPLVKTLQPHEVRSEDFGHAVDKSNVHATVAATTENDASTSQLSDAVAGDRQRAVSTISLPSVSVTSVLREPTRPKKKRKKNMNAIDELFSAL